jgi:Flp pilus assembly protein TadD
VPSIQNRSPQLWPPVFSGSWLVVLLIVLGVLGAALLMGTFLVCVGWIAERMRSFRSPKSIPDDGWEMAFPGDDGDPITRAMQAVELGTTYETEPHLRAIAEQPSPLAPRARLALAYVLSASGDGVEAEAVGREALRANPELLPLCVELCGMHVRAGRERASEGLLRAALTAARPTEQNHEVRFLAHHLYGQVLRHQQRLEEAEGQLRSAVMLRPDDSIARNNYGAVLDALGRVNEARRQYEEGIRLDPDNSPLHANLGGLLLREGYLEEARRHLSRAADLTPERFTAHIQLATLHLKLGRWQEAEVHAGAAVAVRPDVGMAHGSLARALVQLGQFEEAERHARRAVELAPQQASLHATLGYILSQNGQLAEGAQYVRQALLLAPDLPDQIRDEAVGLDALGLREGAMAERHYADFLEGVRSQPI